MFAYAGLCDLLDCANGPPRSRAVNASAIFGIVIAGQLGASYSPASHTAFWFDDDGQPKIALCRREHLKWIPAREQSVTTYQS